MNGRTDLLVIVPARAGSKRLPNKNLRKLGGKSLLELTAVAIVEARLNVPVLLTTDGEAIATEGQRLGWKVPFRRPAALATDEATTIDVVMHALDAYAADAGHDPAIVMVLQPTSPLRGGACLRAALDLLAARADADAVIGMIAINLPPARLFLAGADSFAEMLSSDTHAPVYVPNGALYLVRTAALRAARTLYVPRLLPLVMDGVHSIDIDTEDDWRLAEVALAAGLPESRPAPARPSIARAIA